MEWRRILGLLLVALPLLAQGQASDVTVHRQRAFPRTVPPGNYSGIAWIGGNRYALADDKSPTAGFRVVTIDIDSVSGRIRKVRDEGFKTSGAPNRDEEGIAYVPSTQTVYVCGEVDNEAIEYTLDGQLTGRKLNMPDLFKTAYRNRGLEALTYNAVTRRFWTTSENTLPADGERPSLANPIKNRLRLQSFTDDGQPAEQFLYEMDATVATKKKGKSAIGLSGLAALDDGRIIVLERDYYVAPNKIGSFVNIKLFEVNPSLQRPGELLPKKLLAEFKTKFNLRRQDIANYEGICVGPRLTDGRLVLILVCDSQNRYMGLLEDWFKSVVIK